MTMRFSALLATDGEYRTLFAKTPQPMWVHDRETLRFLEVNDAAVRQYGFLRDALLQMTVADLSVDGEWAGTIGGAPRDIGDCDSLRTRLRGADGTVIEVGRASCRERV